MQAEPSKDARADQPTETICMFTIRKPDWAGDSDPCPAVAAQIRKFAEDFAAVHDWTQTTQVIRTETVVTAEMPWCDGCQAYRTIGHDCNRAIPLAKGAHGQERSPTMDKATIESEVDRSGTFEQELWYAVFRGEKLFEGHIGEAIPRLTVEGFNAGYARAVEDAQTKTKIVGGQGEPSHGPALSPRGRDFVEFAGCAWYLAGAFVFGLGLASLLGWLGWTY